MKLRLLIFAILCGLVATGLLVVKRYRLFSAEAAFERELKELSESTPREGGARSPVLVELFTSEGCSSCPPADTLLMQLAASQPIDGAEVIALSEHVDYWNHLGWADPYSSKFFSERQSDYSRAFHLDDIYTPQMVVDGRLQFVGSNVNRAREAIAKAAAAPKAEVTIDLSSPPKTDAAKSNTRDVTINIKNLSKIGADEAADVLLAVTESGLKSSVSRGENSGRQLVHTAVVRRLDAVGTIQAGESQFQTTVPLSLEATWKREAVKLVAFAQGRKSRRVFGAASVNVP